MATTTLPVIDDEPLAISPALRKHLQKLGQRGGLKRSQTLTPEKRRAIARKGGRTAAANRLKNAANN